MCAVMCTERCRPLTIISTVQKIHRFKNGRMVKLLFFYKYKYTFQCRHQRIFHNLCHYFAYDSPDPRRRCTSRDTAEGYRASGFVASRTWPCSGKVAVAFDLSCQNTGPLVIWRRLHNSWSTGRRHGMIDIQTAWATSLWWVNRDWSGCVVFIFRLT